MVESESEETEYFSVTEGSDKPHGKEQLSKPESGESSSAGVVDGGTKPKRGGKLVVAGAGSKEAVGDGGKRQKKPSSEEIIPGLNTIMVDGGTKPKRAIKPVVPGAGSKEETKMVKPVLLEVGSKEVVEDVGRRLSPRQKLSADSRSEEIIPGFSPMQQLRCVKASAGASDLTRVPPIRDLARPPLRRVCYLR